MSGIVRLRNLYPLESWFFSDIATDPESLKEQWFNNFSDGKILSLPNLNELMIRDIFIKVKKWKEAEDIIDFITKAGPHLVMFKNKDKHKEVLGTVRIKDLSRLYDGSDEQFRLYMQEPFIKGLFTNSNFCVFNSQKVLSEFLTILRRGRVSEQTMQRIVSEVKDRTPEQAFDFVASLIDAVDFMQFMPMTTNYVFPLINQAVCVSKIKQKKFIITTIEQGTVSDAILGTPEANQYVCIVAQKRDFLNKNTGKRFKTWILLIDCRWAFKATSLVIKEKREAQAIKHGRETRGDT